MLEYIFTSGLIVIWIIVATTIVNVASMSVDKNKEENSNA